MTLAHGDDWHLYEDMMDDDGLWLRVDKTAIFIKRSALKDILVALKRLEEHSWRLWGDDNGDNNEETIQGQIQWLETVRAKNEAAMAAKKKAEETKQSSFRSDWVSEDHRDMCGLDTTHCSICGYCEVEGSCVCYSR